MRSDQGPAFRRTEAQPGNVFAATQFWVVGRGDDQTRKRNWMNVSNSEAIQSDVLGARVADLKIRMRQGRITKSEMKTFQKVAAMMVDGRGSIDGDDLIAASFVADMSLDEKTF